MRVPSSRLKNQNTTISLLSVRKYDEAVLGPLISLPKAIIKLFFFINIM